MNLTHTDVEVIRGTIHGYECLKESLREQIQAHSKNQRKLESEIEEFLKEKVTDVLTFGPSIPIQPIDLKEWLSEGVDFEVERILDDSQKIITWQIMVDCYGADSRGYNKYSLVLNLQRILETPDWLESVKQTQKIKEKEDRDLKYRKIEQLKKELEDSSQ